MGFHNMIKEVTFNIGDYQAGPRRSSKQFLLGHILSSVDL
jgi:hypothetical protein